MKKAVICTVLAAVTLTCAAWAQDKVDMPRLEIDGTIKGSTPKPGPGAKCNDGTCNDGGTRQTTPSGGTVTPGPTVPIAVPAQSPTTQEIAAAARSAAEAEFKDAVKALQLEEGDPGLQDTSLLVDWLIDKITDKAKASPYIKLIEALTPDQGAVTPFDKPKTLEEMKALRVKLEVEERELREANEKALDKNLQRLNLMPSPAPPMKRVENALIILASLRGEDMRGVADQILARSDENSSIPFSRESSDEIIAVLSPITPANACKVRIGACPLQGAYAGDQCWCPRMTSPTTYVKNPGLAVRVRLGQYCRSGDTYTKLLSALPLGVTCVIPVNVSPNRAYPRYETVPGRVSKYDCNSTAGRLSRECMEDD